MMTDATKALLTTIEPNGQIGMAFRILVVDATWPAGDPPYTSGTVSVPDIPGPGLVKVYGEDTFDPSVWFDVTSLVTDYSYNQDSGMAIGQLTLTIGAGWSSHDLNQVFREMRVIRVQEKYSGKDADGNTVVSNWEDRCFCLSDGFQEGWDQKHSYSIQAKDVLKLANIDVIAARERYLSMQADLVKEGNYPDDQHIQMVKIGEDSEAYEYALTSREGGVAHPTSISNHHPNWADRPAPQFWCHNARDHGGTLVDYPVPMAVAGNAIQAVFGAGILRINKKYITGPPGDPTDFTVGMGVTGTPDIRCCLYRFTHPDTSDSDGNEVATDLIEGADRQGVPVTASAPGWVAIGSTNYTGWPKGLSLILMDGSGKRYATEDLTYTAGETYITLTTNDTVPVGTYVRYGDANRATDFALRLLLSCGFQRTDSNKPFYLNVPEQPVVLGEARDIVLSPKVIRDYDNQTVIAILEDLRKKGELPPNWIPLASRSGQVEVKTVEQLPAADPKIIPVRILTQAQIDRVDTSVATDVIARGLRLKATNIMQEATTSIVPATPPTPPGAGMTGVTTLDSARITAMLAGNDWAMDARYARTLGWAFHETNVNGPNRTAIDWYGAEMFQIVFGDDDHQYSIDTVELNLTNPWELVWQKGSPRLIYENAGWCDGGNRYNLPNRKGDTSATFTLQSLAVDYWNVEQNTWLPLIGFVRGAASFPDIQRIEADAFDSRGPVTTWKLRVRCLEPSIVQVGTYNEGWWYAIVGFYFQAPKLWVTSEIRGTASLGTTAPFDNADWAAIRSRVRPRTYIMPEQVPWANTQEDVDWLAQAWLLEKVRNLAPRKLVGVRPDVEVWDTIHAKLPNGSEQDYLVTGVDHNHTGISSMTVVDYTAPYYDE